MRGFLDGNVLAASVWHIPASQELFSDGFPLIFGHRCRNSVIKELINDGLAHFKQKQTDDVVSDTEAVPRSTYEFPVAKWRRVTSNLSPGSMV